MPKKIYFLSLILGALLPFHGAITVFFPDYCRFWKEGVLVILGLWVLWNEIKRREFKLPLPEKFALGFLVWGGLLIILSPEPRYALIAFRYLAMGYVAFFVFCRIKHYLQKDYKETVITPFLTAFITSCALSTLLGTWAMWGGGFEVLQNFYSQTISSWVPGQTIPLYHGASGIVRMQGGATGPIEFSHLLLVGLAGLCLFPLKAFADPKTKILVSIILLWGIYHSHSRAALLALVVGIIIYGVMKIDLKKQKKKVGALIAGLIVLVIGNLILNSKLQELLFQRGGTSEHITRPIEAIKLGITAPLTGNLGQIGPAARIKNLKENNDDKALISENVFVDYFAQMGILGVILALGFFWSLFIQSHKRYWSLFGSLLVVLNLATILDMTPLAITIFAGLSMLNPK